MKFYLEKRYLAGFDAVFEYFPYFWYGGVIFAVPELDYQVHSGVPYAAVSGTRNFVPLTAA